ncbi:MAG: CopG family transcriptional regulator [Anaerolineales bacterium]
MMRMMIQITEEQMKALKELAKARKISVSKLVRESVANYTVTAPTQLSVQEKHHQALEFIKKMKTGEIAFHDIEGKTDVAENHDKYLDEIYGTW